MDRPIKFRAWDKTLGVMAYDITAMEFDILPPKDGNNNISRLIYIRNDCWQTDSNTIKNIILMQFTGLLDKNGKEIFEGDIVTVNPINRKDDEDHARNLAICKWGELCKVKGFVFKPIKPNKFGMCGYYNPEMCKFRVIGNVFENPELLTAHNQE